MIQSIMLVALGFLMASLCALLLAPSFWRRAERLTTQRLERTMPMSIADTEADRDQLRASYAIIIRRLEAALSQEKLRSARQLVRISRLEMQIAQLNDTAAQLRGQLDAEHNAASVLRRTIATRVPELRDAAHGARQLVHVRDHEIRSIVNRLRQRDEALAIAQRTTEMQQAEIARLRQAMEMSGAQNAGRFKLRPTQWSIHDYRAEYDRLNVELSKLRERLSVAYDREANQVKQLRTELQQLADQIVTASATLPARATPRALAARRTGEEDDAATGDDMAAARSIDAILANDSSATTQMPALRAATPAENASERRDRSGGLLSAALSPKRLARGAAATIAGLTGAKSDDGSPLSAPVAADKDRSRASDERPAAGLSAAELLGGPAVSRREPRDDSARPNSGPASSLDGDNPGHSISQTTATEETPPGGPATPVAEEAAQEASGVEAPAADSAEPASSDSLYDSLRAAKPASQVPSNPPDEAGATPDDPASPESAPQAKTEPDESEDAPSQTGGERASSDEPAEQTDEPNEGKANAALDPDGDHRAPGNGRDREQGENGDGPASSLLDRLKQVPENQSR